MRIIDRRISGQSRIACSSGRVSTLEGSAALIGLVISAACGFVLTLLGAPLPAAEAARWKFPDSQFVDVSPASATLRGRDLLCRLSSPLDASEFLSQHARRVRHHDPVRYTRNFRMNLDEFQQSGWRGDCNDFANTICEVGYCHGYEMGLISMWPLRWQDRLHKDWHQIAVLCLEPDREYLVFEYETPIHWNGTLEDYARSVNKTIIPIGGAITWRPTKPNLVARFLDHLRRNSSLLENKKPLGPIRIAPVT